MNEGLRKHKCSKVFTLFFFKKPVKSLKKTSDQIYENYEYPVRFMKKL